MKTSRHQDESGIALILTLTILAVVLILLMSFIVSMRTERTAAKASSDLSKAKALAEAGVEEAIGLLQASMTNITPTTSYITAPGIVYSRNGAAWTAVNLFTSGTLLDLNTTNNSITGSGPNYPLGSTPLRVGWFSVPLPNVGPLAGRFAYWVDDESTKVDINTATVQSPRTDPGNTPAAIDLSQLLFSSTEANAISTYASSTRPLDTIESVKLGPPAVTGGPSVSSNSFNNNQFFITANATSPDLTPWGTKRLNLNSLLPASPSAAQKKAAVTTIATALSDPNVATWFGSSFTTKYSQPNQIQQIAANIVDYITKDNIPTDSGTPADTTPPTFLGLKQTPYLNELVISNTVTLTPTTPGQGQITVASTVTAELWYMYTNSAGWIPPLGTSIVVKGIPNIQLSGGSGPQTITLGTGGTVTINSGFTHMVPNPGTTTAGTYLTVTATLPQAGPFTVADTTVATTAKLLPGTITAIFASLPPIGGRMDYAQIKMGLANISGNISGASPNPSFTLVWQAQCNDPRVKPISNTWVQAPNGVLNTLGAANSGTIVNMTAGNGTIPGDGDISCHIVSGSRQRGAMYPSELAYIHTGVPWRTFFLEPQQLPAESGMVPDWLLADMFSGSDPTNVAGRMNINMQDGNSADPARLQPLSALLSGNAASPAPTGNIYVVTLHNTPAIPSFASTATGARPSFTTAGQVCEVTGLADGGGLKSARELPAQEIVNLVTPRSDTFTIWAMGQSIKKVNLAVKSFDPLHGDLITGEVKIQAVVQRYEDQNSTPPGAVRFRTLYYRYIYE